MAIPVLSVVIPCYNQGEYLRELVDCFPGYHEQDVYEIIIVNDGSSDEHTLSILQELEQNGFYILHQQNQGVCITRNNGIRLAKGKYILPVDGDDKISPDFIQEAIEVLENHPEYAIVYCNGEYFNAQTGPWVVGKFNLQRLMLWNYLPSCAVYRKSVWEDTNGYDPNLKALEDWDFWLSAAFAGKKFYYLDKTYFSYRISPDSLSRSTSDARYDELWCKIQKKYDNYLGRAYLSDEVVLRFRNNSRLWIKLFFRVYFPGFFNRLVKKGKVNTPNLD